jgi:predicted DNA-binding transcriptional regulator AlpA
MNTILYGKPLSLTAVAQMMDVSRQTLMRWVRQGRFPKPLLVGNRKLYWPPVDLEEALLRRRAARRQM